ncbi:MAG: winged helix-turn-helix transcriptional regulator [Bacteroidota bacterium]|nr:winged helix-turn-helix transcriptional regulator [Bacteroidota bacterium]
MKIHKREEFSKKKQHLAVWSKAFAHPARIAILKILAKNQECSCNEVVEALPLSQATVSQHLKELKNSGLITAKSVGTRSLYRLDLVALKTFEHEYRKLMKSLHHPKIREKMN